MQGDLRLTPIWRSGTNPMISHNIFLLAENIFLKKIFDLHEFRFEKITIEITWESSIKTPRYMKIKPTYSDREHIHIQLPIGDIRPVLVETFLTMLSKGVMIFLNDHGYFVAPSIFDEFLKSQLLAINEIIIKAPDKYKYIDPIKSLRGKFSRPN